MRTPADVLAALRGKQMLVQLPEHGRDGPAQVVVTIGREIKFSLQTSSQTTAELRRSTVRAHFESKFSAVRAGPQPLTHRQLLGLARTVHQLYVEAFEDEPGERSVWVAHKALNRAAAEGRVVGLAPILPHQIADERNVATGLFGTNLTKGINARSPTDNLDGLEHRFGLLCDWVLARNGLEVDRDVRHRLLKAIALATETGARRIKDNISGDYGFDHRLASYPTYEPVRVVRSTLDAAFERWRAEVDPAPNTVASYRSALNSLQQFLGHDDLARMQRSNIVEWKDSLVEAGRTAKTINATYLAAVKSLINFEISNGRLERNPVEGVKAAGRAGAGERPLPYTTPEVRSLLLLARASESNHTRWLPWLAAFTGARIGELAQLWGRRIFTDGVPALSIAPAEDGGRLKNISSERMVPIHPALIAEGFLDFVRSRGSGPLFYRRTSGDPDRRHASKSVANKVAVWVREQPGFNNPRKAPSHALRHWMKTQLGAAHVPDSLADALMGHARQTVADQYRHYSVEDMAGALSRIRSPLDG